MPDDLPPGATSVDDDEVESLIPSHIQTRADLNAWEQANILAAVRWTRRTRAPVLDQPTIRELHRRMFDRTWEWAGRYRHSNKNLGVDWPQITVAVHDLVEDGRLWIANETFPMDEIALRLHHRLVWIHPFPNGNGRHGRLWTDMFLRQNGRPNFEWKNAELDLPGEARTAYIRALQAADDGDYGPLLELLAGDRRQG